MGVPRGTQMHRHGQSGACNLTSRMPPKCTLAPTHLGAPLWVPPQMVCPAGTNNNGASGACPACPAGKYSDPGSSSCTSCPTNYGSTTTGAAECIPACPVTTQLSSVYVPWCLHSTASLLRQVVSHMSLTLVFLPLFALRSGAPRTLGPARRPPASWRPSPRASLSCLSGPMPRCT